MEVLRHYKKTSVYYVRLEDGTSLPVPEWMTDAGHCARFMQTARPRVSLEALRLLDCLPVDCAEQLAGHENTLVEKNPMRRRGRVAEGDRRPEDVFWCAKESLVPLAR